MSLSNIEEVGASLPDVQSREMQILEEQNDANVQQNFNNRTCSVCNEDATENGNNVKDLQTKIKKLQTELSEANRKSAEKTKEINRLKHQISKDADINGTPNIIDVRINEDINIRRNNGNDKSFLNNFVDLVNLLPWSFEISARKLLTLIWKINIHKETLWIKNKKNAKKQIIVQK